MRKTISAFDIYEFPREMKDEDKVLNVICMF